MTNMTLLELLSEGTDIINLNVQTIIHICRCTRNKNLMDDRLETSMS